MQYEYRFNSLEVIAQVAFSGSGVYSMIDATSTWMEIVGLGRRVLLLTVSHNVPCNPSDLLVSMG